MITVMASIILSFNITYIMYKHPHTANGKIIKLSSFDMDDYEYHEEYTSTFCIDIKISYENAKLCIEGSQ